jgi:hypothetical protein
MWLSLICFNFSGKLLDRFFRKKTQMHSFEFSSAQMSPIDKHTASHSQQGEI